MLELVHTSVRAPKNTCCANDDGVFLRVVWRFFARNFEDCWDDSIMLNDDLSHALGDVLRNEHHSDVFASQQLSKLFFDLAITDFLVDDHEVSLVL